MTERTSLTVYTHGGHREPAAPNTPHHVAHPIGKAEVERIAAIAALVLGHPRPRTLEAAGITNEP
jgi:hypothetical protein